MIAVIDYGAGNLRSVAKAIDKLGYQTEVTNESQKILEASIVILPGVGAAGETMDSLRRLDLIQPIKKVIKDYRPFLGICLGLQVLFDYTEESGGYDCLGLIPGKARLLPPGLKVPHMGWNQVKQKIAHPVFDGIPDEANFYFVHSYYSDPADKSIIAGETDYGFNFCSMIIKGNLIAVQFHLEKSGHSGLKMLDNFLKISLKNK